MLLYWPRLVYPYYRFCSFSYDLLSVYRLVLWGWGLRTVRVYTILSQPSLLTFFNNNNNNNDNNTLFKSSRCLAQSSDNLPVVKVILTVKGMTHLA